MWYKCLYQENWNWMFSYLSKYTLDVCDVETKDLFSARKF